MQKEKRKLNVSGYRGIWGETLTDKIVTDYTKAFARFTKEDTGKEKPTILVGRDGRSHGDHIRNIVVTVLKEEGINPINGDIMPTPTVLFSVHNHKYDGGIIVTASHNPIEYNGLKFVNKKGLFTISKEASKIEDYYEEYAKDKEIKINLINLEELEKAPNFLEEHAERIASNVNIGLIKSKKFKVAVDMINASACVLDPYVFDKLGVEVVPLNNIPNGEFAHKPEPIQENLIEIGELVKISGANLGFVHDPDADRLVVVNELGEVISEEFSITLAIENIVSRNPGRAIVLNLSTSQRGADVAEKYGSPCFRTKIGEGFVVDGIIKHNAVIGGEGNGGIIYPTINTARDSFVGIALILELLAEREKSISEIIETFPKYFIKKDKWPVQGDLQEMYEKLKEHWPEAKEDEQDGLRLNFPDKSWIHLRPSNTEPIIRLFGEAKSQENINNLFKEAENLILK